MAGDTVADNWAVLPTPTVAVAGLRLTPLTATFEAAPACVTLRVRVNEPPVTVTVPDRSVLPVLALTAMLMVPLFEPEVGLTLIHD